MDWVFPVFQGLPAQSEDKVYADIFHPSRLYDMICPARIFRIMATVHPLQNPVIEGLDTHAYTVDSKPGQAADISFSLFNDVLRVDLDGKLLEICPDSSLLQGLEQSLKK